MGPAVSLRAALLGSAILLLAGCSNDTSPEPAKSTALEQASEVCEAGRLGDDGHTLILDMEGEDSFSGDLSYDEVMCVLDELAVPDAVMEKFGSTRSLDGRQSDGWDDIDASWTYHPKNGLDVILEIE